MFLFNVFWLLDYAGTEVMGHWDTAHEGPKFLWVAQPTLPALNFPFFRLN